MTGICGKNKPPVFSGEVARMLLDLIGTDSLIGLRRRGTRMRREDVHYPSLT
jgi:hypothetical protein